MNKKKKFTESKICVENKPSVSELFFHDFYFYFTVSGFALDNVFGMEICQHYKYTMYGT